MDFIDFHAVGEVVKLLGGIAAFIYTLVRGIMWLGRWIQKRETDSAAIGSVRSDTQASVSELKASIEAVRLSLDTRITAHDKHDDERFEGLNATLRHISEGVGEIKGALGITRH